MKINLVAWLRQIWPSKQKARDVVAAYAAIGSQHRLFLTDVALRGRVWSDLHVPGDDTATMINIGRRELALEIIELAGEPIDRLFALVERAATRSEKIDD